MRNSAEASAAAFQNWTRARQECMNDFTTQTILLVEDDQALAVMVSDFLRQHSFEVSVEGRGDLAVERIRNERPDAVILDITLPGLDGISVCRTVRTEYQGTILILTARGDEVDEVVSLEVGADDYMTKPVRPRALLARLQMHLRRHTAPGPETDNQPLVAGSLVVDPARRSVEIDGQPVLLTTAEFDLLYLLAGKAGYPISRHDIYERIHGMKYDGLDRSIDLRISRLRKKLGDDPANPERIKSVRGVGYMLSIER